MNPGRIRIGELEEEQERAGSINREMASALGEQQRQSDRKEDSLPEGHQGPERFPTSEFTRRGDAGTSASDKAFKVIQQRRDNAEKMKQVQTERQEEMVRRQQQSRMKSNQQPKGRAGGRRPGEGKNAYRNRMRRQGGRR